MTQSLQDDLFAFYLQKNDLTYNDKELLLLLYKPEHKES